MAEITLAAETGRPTGSRASKRLRAKGMIPGVVYGLGREPVAVTVEWKALRAALTTDAGLNALLDLQVQGERRLSIVKDIQRDPILGSVRHVDFLLIEANTAITVDVPIHLEGEATNVINQQGTVDHNLQALTVSALPGDIPDNLTVDISGLEIGDTIRVGDVSLPSGVTTEVDPEEAVVVAQVSAAAIEAEQLEAEAAEAAEEEAAEGEEGAVDEGGAEGEAAEGGESDAEES